GWKPASTGAGRRPTRVPAPPAPIPPPSRAAATPPTSPPAAPSACASRNGGRCGRSRNPWRPRTPAPRSRSPPWPWLPDPGTRSRFLAAALPLRLRLPCAHVGWCAKNARQQPGARHDPSLFPARNAQHPRQAPRRGPGQAAYPRPVRQQRGAEEGSGHAGHRSGAQPRRARGLRAPAARPSTALTALRSLVTPGTRCRRCPRAFSFSGPVAPLAAHTVAMRATSVPAAGPKHRTHVHRPRRLTSRHAPPAPWRRIPMKGPNGLPQALYRANLQLQARIAELLHDGSRQWLDFGQRLVEEGLLERDAELRSLGRHDWQALAALPADAFWRQVQQRFGDQQAAAQVSVAVQAAFARGLQEAMREWRRDTAAALDEAGLGFPVDNPMWSALFQGWDALPGLVPGFPGHAPTAS